MWDATVLGGLVHVTLFSKMGYRVKERLHLLSQPCLPLHVLCWLPLAAPWNAQGAADDGEYLDAGSDRAAGERLQVLTKVAKQIRSGSAVCTSCIHNARTAHACSKKYKAHFL